MSGGLLACYTLQVAGPRPRLLTSPGGVWRESSAGLAAGPAYGDLLKGNLATESPNPPKRSFPAGRCDFFCSHQKVTHFGVNRRQMCNIGCEWVHRWCEHVRGVYNLVEVCT